MLFNELLNERAAVQRDIHVHFVENIMTLKESAEYMSECATNMRGQGFAVFLQAREEFLKKVNELQEQLELSSFINTLPASKAGTVSK